MLCTICPNVRGQNEAEVLYTNRPGIHFLQERADDVSDVPLPGEETDQAALVGSAGLWLLDNVRVTVLNSAHLIPPEAWLCMERVRGYAFGAHRFNSYLGEYGS